MLYVFVCVSQKDKLFIQHPVVLYKNISWLYLPSLLSCTTFLYVRDSYLGLSLFISTSFFMMALLVLSYKKAIVLFCFHKLIWHMNQFVYHWINDFLGVSLFLCLFVSLFLCLSVCLCTYVTIISLILRLKFGRNMDAEFYRNKK